MDRNNDPNAFLMGGSVPSASFERIGDSITGTISESPMLRQQTEIGTGELKVWSDGQPMMQLIVTIATDLRDREIDDDDGHRRLYVKGNMQKAVASAVRSAKAKSLEVGGRLTVKYTGDGEAKQRGFSPPKLYQAVYVPPAASFLEHDQDEPPSPPRSKPNGNNAFSAADVQRQAKADAWKKWKAKRPGISDADNARELKDVIALACDGRTPEQLGAADWRKLADADFLPPRNAIAGNAGFDDSDIPFSPDGY